MTQGAEHPGSDQPCERMDRLGKDAGDETGKAWSDQESEGEALAGADEGPVLDPEKTQTLGGQVRSRRADGSKAASQPLPASPDSDQASRLAARLKAKLERGLRRAQPFPGSD